MKKDFRYKFLIFAVICLFCSSCVLPTSSTTVKGRVTDYNKRPVADAEVSFGGTAFENRVKTDADGKFTVTARHRPTQMLHLTVSKSKVGTYSDKFPGFAAPDKTIEVELMPTLETIPRTR